MNEEETGEQWIKEMQESKKWSERIDFLPDATIVIDRQGRVIAWNGAMEKMTGVNASHMIGKDRFEYAAHFYGGRRPILAELVLESLEAIERDHPSVSRGKDILQCELSVSCEGRKERILSVSAYSGAIRHPIPFESAT